MNIDLRKLDAFPAVQLINRLSFSRGIIPFLVGGAVRDLLTSGVHCVDLDFALTDGFEDLPRELAKALNGSFFWLDEERKQSRVVLSDPRPWAFDFAPLRGASIIEDLQQRDFTINALAIELTSPDGLIIDPLNGVGDMGNRILRQCSAYSFRQDPLRLLRAFRFAAALGYCIEEETWKRLEDDSALLSAVAPERVRDELFRILRFPGFAVSLEKMVQAGVMQHVVPVRIPEVVLLWNSRVEAASRMEMARNELHCHERTLERYLESELEPGVNIRSLLLLAALLSQDDEDDCSTVAVRLKLSNRSRQMLLQTIRQMKHPPAIAETTLTSRSMYRFFKDAASGPEAVLAAFFTKQLSHSASRCLIDFYFSDFSSYGELVTGDEVMKDLHLREGTEVGNILRLIRDAEISGEVNTKQEALDYLRTKLLTKVRS